MGVTNCPLINSQYPERYSNIKMYTKNPLLKTIYLLSIIMSCQSRFINDRNMDSNDQILFNVNDSAENRMEAVNSYLQMNSIDPAMSMMLSMLASQQSTTSSSARSSMNSSEMLFELRNIVKSKIAQHMLSRSKRV